MGYPAEVFATGNFKTSLLKRCGVFLERRQVALFLLLFLAAKLVLQGAAESGKSIVHIDHHTNSPGCEQAENIARAIELLSGTMTVADCVYANDELKGVLQFRKLLPQTRREVFKQCLVLRHAKLALARRHAVPDEGLARVGSWLGVQTVRRRVPRDGRNGAGAYAVLVLQCLG